MRRDIAPRARLLSCRTAGGVDGAVSGSVCARCSNPLPAGVTVCLSCGQPVAIPPPAAKPPESVPNEKFSARSCLLALGAMVGVVGVLIVAGLVLAFVLMNLPRELQVPSLVVLVGVIIVGRMAAHVVSPAQQAADDAHPLAVGLAAQNAAVARHAAALATHGVHEFVRRDTEQVEAMGLSYMDGGANDFRRCDACGLWWGGGIHSEPSQ